jgi:PAS domain S-box-containing protein
MPFHPLLARQLHHLQLTPDHTPALETWAKLLERVDRAYTEADQDRYTLERSIEISGDEMRELYADLARKHEALLENRQRIHATFEHSAVGQAVIDEAGSCTEVNDALVAMLGYSIAELIGAKLINALAPTERAQFALSLRELLTGERQTLAAEQQWRTKQGVGLWVHLSLSLVPSSADQPRFAALFVQDITERKRLEIELRLVQKLESVGRLASGIAHEINTPVQFVGDNLPFLEEAADANRKLRGRFRELLDRAIAAGSVQAAEVDEAEHDADIEYLDKEVPRALAQTRDGLERVATIVRAMKDFAHPDAVEQANADINRALASTITVASSEYKMVAEVITDFAEIPPVLCNLGDLNQAFLNLLVNASHAIADTRGSSGRLGTIRVRTAVEGAYVLISISDTGGGIPEAVQPRIFEPFFTTKGVGRGTGQGLAISRSVIVDRHGGQLTFRTVVGEGTTFEIRLPIHESDRTQVSDERPFAA